MENKIKSAEEILSSKFRTDFYAADKIIEAMKEYAKQVVDAQLEVAAEEAELMWDGNPYTGEGSDYVDRDSIRNCTRIILE